MAKKNSGPDRAAGSRKNSSCQGDSRICITAGRLLYIGEIRPDPSGDYLSGYY